MRLIQGDCLDVLPTLAEGSVQTCITSPPFYRLRDYGTGQWEGGLAGCAHLAQSWTTRRDPAETGADVARDGRAHRRTCEACGARRVDRQIGLEQTPAEYVARMVEVFRAVRRVLRDDGTLWLNLGDSYGASGGDTLSGFNERYFGKPFKTDKQTATAATFPKGEKANGVRAKNLLGMPWRVAFALQDDGWYLRSDIIWHKPNPMPESVTDRPTKAHEYLFLLAKNARYFYDADAVRESAVYGENRRTFRGGGAYTNNRSFNNHASVIPDPDGERPTTTGRNCRSVWTVATESFSGAHFATFPTALIEPCVLAGTSAKGRCPHCGAPWVRMVRREIKGAPKVCPSDAAGWEARRNGQGRDLTDDPVHTTGLHSQYLDVRHETTGWQPSCPCPEHEPAPCVILDPFAGAGTTGVVAYRHGRDFVGVELSAAYCALARARFAAEASAPLFDPPPPGEAALARQGELFAGGQ